MIISRDKGGRVVGWRETYISKDEIVNVSVVGNINTINGAEQADLKDSNSSCLPSACV
jgi:hypothetical protein